VIFSFTLIEKSEKEESSSERYQALGHEIEDSNEFELESEIRPPLSG
jgi:hypothetical protein